MKSIMLASRSPRRRDMLKESGFVFRVDAVDTEESFPASLSPDQAAMHIARAKADASISLCRPGELLLAADTVVAVDSTLLAKPADQHEAALMLRTISGRTHQVITGVVIAEGKERTEFFERTEVDVANLSDEAIDYYIRQFKPFDKAGSYAIQEWIGLTHITAIRGCYWNVVGLPMPRLYSMLTLRGAAKSG